MSGFIHTSRRALLSYINTKKYSFGQVLGIDLCLTFCILVLSLFGLLAIYSASNGNEVLVHKQANSIIAGFALLFLIARLPISRYRDLIPFFWAGTMLLLIAVFFVGDVSKGGQRWLNLAGIRFQPSEIAKLSVPLTVAYYLRDQTSALNWPQFATCLAIIGLPALIIMKQPDLGTAILVLMSGGWLLVIVGMRRSIWISAFLLFCCAIPALWFNLYDYQRYRILMLFNPENDPFGAGYNIIQSKIAVGAGGLWGKGWMLGTQARLKYLPEAFTDFIFAVFGEEFGLIGCCVLTLVVLFMVCYMLSRAARLTDNFERLVISGLALVFFEAFFINVGMVIGILPVVGVPLPLISYGGSSLLTFFISFGLIMSIENTATERFSASQG